MVLLNGKEVISKFPNGELLVKGFSGIEQAEIVAKFESSDDILGLYFLVRELNRAGKNDSKILIPYFPYSRMDRKESPDIAFTLASLADLMYEIQFAKMLTLEAHSKVSTDMIIGMESILSSLTMLKDYLTTSPDTVVVFPDKGAELRYGDSLYDDFPNVEIRVANKVRDFSTGRISALEVGGPHLEGKNVVIVDDLCSYGGTFVMCSHELKKKGANNIDLIITHAENAILDGNIFKENKINRVFTTDSILDVDNPLVKHYKDCGRLVVKSFMDFYKEAESE